MEFLLLTCLVLLFILLVRVNSHFRHINQRMDQFEVLLKKRFSKDNTGLQDIPSNHQKQDSEPLDEPIESFEHVPGIIFEEVEKEVVFTNTIQQEPLHRETIPEPLETITWWEKFKIRNPDLEKFIGENLISKIGITILVLGIAFFVKYAIDKNWINETARVGIGFLCGALVNFVAHRLRLKFKAFSSVLVAGAIAIYYFTIAIAFQEYHLFSQGMAFALMIAITAFSLLVSISYNREELAILSLIGGFATPLMVSTGAGNYIVLFTYLLLLDIGILILAYLRKWNIVNLCTFFFTLLFYITWFYNKVYHNPTAPYAGAFLFASLFYLVFTAMILINDLKEKRQSGKLELFLFLGNTAIYYAVGMYLINTHFPLYDGLYTALMAVLNMIIGWVLFKYLKAEMKLIYLLVGLALTFVTLAAPVQLDGNHITLFWAAESVLLLWLSLKSELRNFLYSSVIVSVLMVCSLLMDWFQYYTGIVQVELPIVFNQLFLTGIFSCFCLFVKIKLINKHPGASRWLPITLDPAVYQIFLRSVAIILLYFVCIFELNYQLRKYLQFNVSVNIILGAFHMVYCTILLLYFYYHKSKKLLSGAYLSSVINILFYAVILSSIHLTEIDQSVYTMQVHTIGYKMHFISLFCLLVMFFYLYKILAFHSEVVNANKNFMSWLLAGLVVYICSSELMLIFCAARVDDFLLLIDNQAVIQSYPHLKTQIIKTGFPILWSLISILFLVYGIKRQNKNVRIFSLVLQAVTILKLFTYDINNVSEAGKIVAFIILGIILLIMSFMYQKIKAIIFRDEKA